MKLHCSTGVQSSIDQFCYIAYLSSRLLHTETHLAQGVGAHFLGIDYHGLEDELRKVEHVAVVHIGQLSSVLSLRGSGATCSHRGL